MSKAYYKDFENLSQEHINNILRARRFKLRESGMYKFSSAYQRYNAVRGHATRGKQINFLMDDESRIIPVQEKLKRIMKNYGVPYYMLEEFSVNSNDVESFIEKCKKWGGDHVY